VKVVLRPSNAKRLYMNEKRKEKETVLLLCLTSILQPVWLGWP